MTPVEHLARDIKLTRTSGPFVGRGEELARFAGVLERGSGGVVVHGPPGIGRTRLAEELVRLAAANGAATRFIRGRSTVDGLSLGAFIPLLPAGLELAEGVSLLVGARQAIESLAAGGTVVLGIDDAHLLDTESAILVHQLATSATVIVVATTIDGARAPHLISELWQTGLVDRWRLGPLSREQSLEMAESLSGRPVDPLIGEELWHLTTGVPMFINALARAMAETDIGGGLGAAAGSESLVDFAAARLSFLAPELRDTLAVVALGEPIGLDVLERLTDGQALVELERAGWLQIDQGHRRTEVTLTHPLFGAILRRRLSKLVVRSVSNELVEVLREDGAHREEDGPRLAQWSLDGGTGIGSIELVAASHRAFASGDVEQAERFATSAWEIGPSFDAGLMILTLHGARYRENPRAFLRHLDRLTDGPGQIVPLGMATAFAAMWRDGDLQSALRLMDRALLSVTSPVDRRETLGRKAWMLAVGSRPVEAIEVLGEIAVLDEAEGVSSAGHQVALTRQLLASVFGDPRPLIAALLRDEESCDVEQRSVLYQRHNGISTACVQVADGPRAVALARAGVTAPGNARRIGVPEARLARVLLWTGAPLEASEWAHRAAGIQRRGGFPPLVRSSEGTMALIAAYRGEVDDAEALLDRLDADAGRDVMVWDHDRWHARAILALDGNDLSSAQHHARLGIEQCRTAGALFDEGVACHLLARAGHAVEMQSRLREIAGSVGGLVDLFADHAVALAAADGEALATVVERTALTGILTIAATMATDAARLAQRQHDVRAAQRMLRRSRELVADLDQLRFVAASVLAEPLTRRERDVAQLASTGLTSREVAAQLFLSVRTIDNHLANVYDKLGISGRTELREALDTD